MAQLPTFMISREEYNALPQHTEQTLPPLDTLPNGYKCRNEAGQVCELVNHEDLFADQVGLLSAPERGFRYFQPVFVEGSKQDALNRLKRAEDELRLAQENLAKFN